MKNLKKNSRIGVWGYGKVGQSIVNYLLEKDHRHIYVMDKRKPTHNEIKYLQTNNIEWYQEEQKDLFFNVCEFIFSSPGVDIKKICYATRKQKFITELDLFYNNFNKPIISVTGSIGKTSTVSLLHQLLQSQKVSCAFGGNIGIPMLSLLSQQNTVDYALLEVSSFQLLHCTDFAPHLAIITNIYPNHLDFHATMDEYIEAKFKNIRYQKENSISLVPLTLQGQYTLAFENHIHAYFSVEIPQISILHSLKKNECIFYIENNMVIKHTATQKKIILNLTQELLSLSFIDNILILASVCDLLSLAIEVLPIIAPTFILPDHRVEKITTFNNIEFYNDSKATTTASTLAAVEKLKERPVHLFLGGLSKGVDRSSFVAQLHNNVKHIYCFGHEADILYALCLHYNIPASSHDTLENAVAHSFLSINNGDRVLLSPAGSSYDLYQNYEERGMHFKELITSFIQKYTFI